MRRRLISPHWGAPGGFRAQCDTGRLVSRSVVWTSAATGPGRKGSNSEAGARDTKGTTRTQKSLRGLVSSCPSTGRDEPGPQLPYLNPAPH